MPGVIDGGEHFWSTNGELNSLWGLAYPSVTAHLHNVGPDVSKVDWEFIIGYVLSFVGLLFVFDSISGERQQGTMRLILSNSIPRYTVLLGKF